MKTTTLLLSLCGMGALVLLAGLFPGLPAQAAPHNSSATFCCDFPVGPTLNRDHTEGGQAFEMDDEDGDEVHGQVLVIAQGPSLESARLVVAGDGYSDQGTWFSDASETQHAVPAQGCTLRKRILKKTR